MRARRVVVEKRVAHYVFRSKVHRLRREGRVKLKDDPGGTGVETAQELQVCSACSGSNSYPDADALRTIARGPPLPNAA